MMSAPPKSVTKSIIRTMEMNGTLDGHGPDKAGAPKVNASEINEHQGGGEGEDDDDDDEDDNGGDDENEEEDEKGNR